MIVFRCDKCGAVERGNGSFRRIPEGWQIMVSDNGASDDRNDRHLCVGCLEELQLSFTPLPEPEYRRRSTIRPADPELEALLDEEEQIARRAAKEVNDG